MLGSSHVRWSRRNEGRKWDEVTSQNWDLQNGLALGISLCLSNFNDLSAKLSAFMRVCACMKQGGSLHAEAVTALY